MPEDSIVVTILQELEVDGDDLRSRRGCTQRRIRRLDHDLVQVMGEDLVLLLVLSAPRRPRRGTAANVTFRYVLLDGDMPGACRAERDAQAVHHYEVGEAEGIQPTAAAAPVAIAASICARSDVDAFCVQCVGNHVYGVAGPVTGGDTGSRGRSADPVNIGC